MRRGARGLFRHAKAFTSLFAPAAVLGPAMFNPFSARFLTSAGNGSVLSQFPPAILLSSLTIGPIVARLGDDSRGQHNHNDRADDCVIHLQLFPLL